MRDDDRRLGLRRCAQADAKAAFNTLFLGLGAVALLADAIGVANVVVISVLEHRSETGLRRALGAARGHIRTQFLAEAITRPGIRRGHRGTRPRACRVS